MDQTKTSKANELYIKKLIKIVHFLARNNLPVKELYPGMIKFLSDEINEPIVNNILRRVLKILYMILQILVTQY